MSAATVVGLLVALLVVVLCTGLADHASRRLTDLGVPAVQSAEPVHPGEPARGRGEVAPAVLVLLARQLAAVARAGLAPERAWRVLAEHADGAEPRALAAVVAARLDAGGSAAEGLRAAGDGAALGWLAVAVEVSQASGAPLAGVLERFAEGLQADTTAADERAAALAGPRATAMILSLLPVAGLVLAALLGADPLWLTDSWPGRGCLVIGGALWLAGRWWTAALIRRATL